MTNDVLPKLDSAAEAAPVAGVMRVHFAPDTLEHLHDLIRNVPGKVNPAMVLASRYGSAVVVHTLVPYLQVLHTGMTPVPMVRGLEYACAWWGGYRAARRELGETAQEGWWIHHQNVDHEHLVLSSTDVQQMQSEVVWQVGVDAHAPRAPELVLLSSVIDSKIVIRAFALEGEPLEARELTVELTPGTSTT